jgi:predicted O-methyltransferase YrrM
VGRLRNFCYSPSVQLDPVAVWCEAHGAGPNAEWEFRQVIKDALDTGPIETVLEVGTHAGDSLLLWQTVFEPNLLVGVELEDSPRCREGVQRTKARMVWGASDIPPTWAAVKNLLHGRPVDFLYIDGDHSFETARTDFYTYASLVRPGGLIVLDDVSIVCNPTIEVHRLVPELSVRHRTKVISGCTDYTVDDTTGGKLLVWSPPHVVSRDEALEA